MTVAAQPVDVLTGSEDDHVASNAVGGVVMSLYEDDTVCLDADGVAIKNYRRRGDTKRISYEAIHRVKTFEMGFWSGRHRLIGLSAGRPRNWFPWERDRRTKRLAVSLDVGRLILPTFTPDHPGTVVAMLDEMIDVSSAGDQ